MNRIIAGLRKLQLRQLLATFLVAFAFLVSSAVGHSYAQAAPTASAIQEAEQKTEEAGSGLIESLKETANTVKEKLNLDEPLPESTKAFAKQVQGKEVNVEEPRPSGKGEVPKNE